MQTAKVLRDITNSRRVVLFEEAKHIIFKQIESFADRGRDNYTLDIGNLVYVKDDLWFKLEKSEFEMIKSELKQLDFIVKSHVNFPNNIAIISW